MLCFVLAFQPLRVTRSSSAAPRARWSACRSKNYFKAQGDYPLGAALAITVLVGYLLLQGLLLLALKLLGVRRVEWGT